VERLQAAARHVAKKAFLPDDVYHILALVLR
jgi:hypothetical protein